MNLEELRSYNLADAVKFNSRLNPRLWGSDEHLRPEVREALLKIADDFREFLGVDNIDLEDITVSGSNAAYTYTPHSDIDLHLVVRPPAAADDVYRELFNAKKYQYNDQHDIKIGGYDVELYVQDADQPHVSQGIYSVKNNDWIQVPRRRRAQVDDISTRSKYEDVATRIEQAIASGSEEQMAVLWNKIKAMRQTGLAEHGEFGPENLAFKMLRTQGAIERLNAARNQAHDQRLSLKEKQPSAPRVYGFKTPVTEVGLTPDGVSPDTKMFLSEEPPPDNDTIISQFTDYACEALGLEHCPRIRIKRDPAWSERNRSFGRYDPGTDQLFISTANRHIIDVLRTLAHELVHARQAEHETLPDDAGETGSSYENEANAVAGQLMREFGRAHPEYFKEAPIEEQSAAGILQGIQALGGLRRITRAGVSDEASQELRNYIRAQGGDAGSQNQSVIYQQQRQQPSDTAPGVTPEPDANPATRYIQRDPQQQNEGASGYIPTKKQARDPRFSMALTQDIRPGQVGKEANKLGLQTDSQGHPALLIKNLKNQLREYMETGRLDEKYHAPISQVPGEVEDDLGNQEPPGPEFPPQWPEGTTKIDVSDLTDWYRLGMDISDMDDARPEDYNQGPPQTVIVFPSDEMEQPYLKQFKRLGLKTHDMDAGGEHMHESVLSEEILDEISQTPGAIQDWAKDSATWNIKAGFEAELIFPSVGGSSEDEEWEPDYDMDERAYSIDDIVQFYTSGDAGMSQAAGRRLRDRMFEDWIVFTDEQLAENWNRDQFAAVMDYVKQNEMPKFETWLTEWCEQNGHDFAAIKASAREQNKQDPNYQLYVTASEMYTNELERIVDEAIDEENNIYDDARDQYFDEERENVADEEAWLRSQGIRMMSDVGNEYDAEWPYYRPMGGEGDVDANELGESLSSATGKPVTVSQSYHSATRRANTYIIEPDSSLEPDDGDGTGLEVVSPPMPLPETLAQLKLVINWARKVGAYTNSSTGLHMNISVPNQANIDYVKTVLFMGDRYILEKFGRESNTYTRSAMEKLQAKHQGKDYTPQQLATVFQTLRSEDQRAAFEAIQAGIGRDKYTSAHQKSGYIEFRSPGGNYLGNDAEEVGSLENTMLRFARAMSIGADPTAYQREYSTKLYKLLTAGETPRGLDVTMKLFADYNAGTVTPEALKRIWAQQVIKSQEKPSDRPTSKARAAKAAAIMDKPVTSGVRADQVRSDNGVPLWNILEPGGGVLATIADHNVAAARQQANTWLRSVGKTDPTAYAVVPRLDPNKAATANRLWQIVDHAGNVVSTFLNRNDLASAEQYARTYIASLDNQDESYSVRPADQPLVGAARRAAQAAAPAGGQFTGEWQIVSASTGEELHRFGGIGNAQADANRVAQRWVRNTGFDDAIEVVPVMAESGRVSVMKALLEVEDSWQDLYKKNIDVVGADPNLIRPGQQLQLPGGGTYTVKPGDTLSGIAAGQTRPMQPAVPTPATAPVTTSATAVPAVKQDTHDAVFQSMLGAESGNRDTDPRTGLPMTSSKGAKYAAQVLPAVAKDPGYGVTPAQADTAEEYNRVGREYFQAMVKKYGGDTSKAVAAYNMGPGALDKLIAKHGEDYQQRLPKETRHYLAKVAAGTPTT